MSEPPESRLDEVDADPLRQFAAWLADEQAAGGHAPEAMALATAAADGRPSLRMVLLRGSGERGLVFYTNYESRKAQELDANPRAALLFHWPRLGRQVRVEGIVARIDAGESAAYFATRPRGHQLAAWASRQSTPVERAKLEAAVDAHAERFAGSDVPLPPSWGGYRLAPDAWEFWQHRADRLHDRFRYTIAPGGGWEAVRLAP